MEKSENGVFVTLSAFFFATLGFVHDSNWVQFSSFCQHFQGLAHEARNDTVERASLDRSCATFLELDM